MCLVPELYDEAALGNGICDVEPLGRPADEFTFRVKYLGSTLVEKPSSKEATAEAVKTVISMAKAGGRKPRRVELRVNLHGVKMVDVPAEDIRLDVSIYRYGCVAYFDSFSVCETHRAFRSADRP